MSCSAVFSGFCPEFPRVCVINELEVVEVVEDDVNTGITVCELVVVVLAELVFDELFTLVEDVIP